MNSRARQDARSPGSPAVSLLLHLNLHLPVRFFLWQRSECVERFSPPAPSPSRTVKREGERWQLLQGPWLLQVGCPLVAQGHGQAPQLWWVLSAMPGDTPRGCPSAPPSAPPSAAPWLHAFAVGGFSREPWAAANAECPVQGPLAGAVPSEGEMPPHTDQGLPRPAPHKSWVDAGVLAPDVLTLCSRVTLDRWFKAWVR